MANTISGLFGMQSPQQLQQDYLSGLMVSPAQMGQQGLLQQLASVGANAGAMMGYGGGRLLGGKVSGEVEAGLVNNALEQVNKMGIKDPAQKMAKIGEILSANPATAKQGMIALQEANKLKEQGYEMGAMEREENYRKDLAALGANPTTAQLAALDKKYGKVPEVRAAVTAAEAKAEKKAVTEKEAKRIKTIAEALVKRDSKLPLAFAEVIAGDPKALMDFVNPKVKTQVVSVNKRELLINSDTGVTIKDLGNSTSKAPIINIAGNQENEFVKGRGKNQADELRDAKKAAGSSKVALLSLEQMERVNIDGIYSGPQADVLLATNGFLESVGLLSSDQVGKLTNSATYDKNAKDLVMLDLDGKLGAQVSDADRKYVEARIPQLRTNPQARTELIVKLREIHNNKIDKADKMVAHANEFNNLNNFKWNPPKPKTTDQGWGIKKIGG
jgi:hypothetical protein